MILLRTVSRDVRLPNMAIESVPAKYSTSDSPLQRDGLKRKSIFRRHIIIFLVIWICAQEDVQEDFGWKLVHGEVFRAPRWPIALSVLVGNGAQLVTMAGITLGL